MTEILRVINGLDDGAPARHVLAVTMALDGEYPSRLVTGSVARGDVLDSDGLTATVLPIGRPIRPVADARALIAFRRLVAETRPRLVETHLAKAGMIGRASLLRSDPRPKTLHTYHHSSGVTDYLRAGPARAFLEVERRLARRTDLLVAVRPELRDELLDLGVGRCSQWRVVPRALDPEPYRLPEGLQGRLRRHFGIPDHVSLVGTFARLATVKDYPTLLQALKLTPDLHLVVAGDGDHRSALEKQAEAAGLEDRTYFAGWWADVPGGMEEVDLVVLSSASGSEPGALWEAGLARRPVVATTVSNTNDIIHDGVNGVLVPPGDPGALAHAMQQLCTDQPRRREMGRMARLLALQTEARETLAALRDVYSELGLPAS